MPLSQFNPNEYDQLLLEKKQRLTELLSPYNPPSLEVHSSPDKGFRMRAEFRFWHTETGGFLAMFAQGSNTQPIEVKHFPIAHEHINQLMQQLLDAVLIQPILLEKLYQVEFLTTLNQQHLITLIYHKKLNTEWESAARKLEHQLNASIVGRSRQQKVIISNDYVDEILVVNNKTLHYRQMEGGFTQPNAYINQKMLGWAEQRCHDQTNKRDLLELYCGNGNFTAALAPYFKRVLATEISKTSVKAAEFNFNSNCIGNVQVCRMSSEEITSALNNEREFRRLKAQAIDINEYEFSTIFVDPPRAGLDPATLALCQRFDRIIYVSCNPVTLAENLQVLCTTHDVKHAALFDQFPYTHHIETGLYLERRS